MPLDVNRSQNSSEDTLRLLERSAFVRMSPTEDQSGHTYKVRLPRSTGTIYRPQFDQVQAYVNQRQGDDMQAAQEKLSNAIHALESNEDYAVVTSRLIALADRSDEDYDEDFWPAEFSAIQTALGLIQGAGLRLGASFPRALVAPNGIGGLSVEWRKPGKALKLIVSPNQRQIFHLFGDEASFDDATDTSLSEWLRRFID